MIADMTAWKESLMGSMRQPKDRSEELWPPLKHCLAWSAISASTTVCVVCLFYYYYIYLSYIFIMYDVIIYIYCKCSVVIRSEMLKNWPHRQQLAWRFPCTRRKAVWGAEEPELDYKGDSRYMFRQRTRACSNTHVATGASGRAVPAVLTMVWVLCSLYTGTEACHLHPICASPSA